MRVERKNRTPETARNLSYEELEIELSWALPIGPSALNSIDILRWIVALANRQIDDLLQNETERNERNEEKS